VKFFTTSPSNPEEKVVVDLTNEKEKFVGVFNLRRDFYPYNPSWLCLVAKVFLL
jgi:hypothetical protein